MKGPLPLDLEGPYPLDWVDYFVADKEKPGTFILSQDGKIHHYIGRADSGLGDAIKEAARRGDYSFFWFKFAESPEEAFHTHCHLWHLFNPPHSPNHPTPPPGQDWKCRECEA
ncbi:hypothetical protein H5T87_07215 [bacterium]|nr:hypothetical protein [bacterium]